MELLRRFFGPKNGMVEGEIVPQNFVTLDELEDVVVAMESGIKITIKLDRMPTRDEYDKVIFSVMSRRRVAVSANHNHENSTIDFFLVEM